MIKYQWSEAHFVSERDVGSSVEQSSDHVYMSVFCGPDDGRPAAAILKHRADVKHLQLQHETD